MKNAGFKIVDRYEDVVIEIIDEAKKQCVPLEMGLYIEHQQTRDYVSGLNVFTLFNVHFNHNRYAIVDIDRTWSVFEEDILVSKQMGAEYGIQHISRSPMTRQKGYEGFMYESVLECIEKAERLCSQHGFDIYLENTYEPIEFYRTLYNAMKAKGLKRIHFCFDIGHAKVWSGQTFAAWIGFLGELRESGFKLHFHLHANRGLRDEHLSFIEMQEIGFDGNDGIFSEQTYAEMLQVISANFPESRKIFEVKSQYAKENLLWVQALSEV